MEIMPTFTAPYHDKTLFLHLTTPFDGISTILLAERRKIYIPIYFANRALKGIEQNYTNTERLILALVNAARCLRNYFQEHPIRVLTDKPIKWMLSNRYRSRRIAKWALKLEEHNIKYRKEDFVDGQIQTSVFSAPNQVSTSTNKELLREKRKNKLLSSGSKAVGMTANQSYTKSLRSDEGIEAPNLFAPEDLKPPAHRNMKVSGNSALTKPTP
ncbi:hypothetical protein CTI12_AA371240 [Artemisia annua]|uniref:Reverse transcriptase RNase H-like domain-containing protein n=1 Tax=Artemisia annua TaxID=35608 RepID=A0A2U1MK37_ARTAN|nr:hypothetical protein CTI12_AA371240 [Artemisia annua]